jgi:hypothetical protein
MVRYGLLFPNSKLLPGVVLRCDADGWEAECCFECVYRCIIFIPLFCFVLSCTDGLSLLPPSFLASIITKSSVAKDERDTLMRWMRHHDGKRLRSEIGLTTGLGWSDG